MPVNVITAQKSVRTNSVEKETMAFYDKGGLFGRSADKAVVKPVP